MKKPVAYLGPQGTFTHEATRVLFSLPEYQLIPCPSIPEVLSQVEQGQYHYGVVPVENAIEGSVLLTLDHLVNHHRLSITGELIYPITQHLMVHPDNKEVPLTSITKVLSHSHAIAQCREFLGKKMPTVRISEVESTAEGALQVQENPQQRWAAIAPYQAHQYYHLRVIASQIHDYPNNYTRFLTVGKKWGWLAGRAYTEKTTLLISLPKDFPGALAQVLDAFVKKKINLTRIESRPTKKQLGCYYFFIDASESMDSLDLQETIDRVRSQGCEVRVLGSYYCYRVEK